MASIRTLLVDCEYLLKRSFSGAKNTYTKAGFMGGLYGFLTKIRQLIKEHQINKVVLMWDGENGGFDRYLIDPAYKSNRSDKSWHKRIELTEEEIRQEQAKKESMLVQKIKIQNYAEELYLRQLEVYKTEADDLIAGYIIRNSKHEDIILYSRDKDYLQLLDYGIKIKNDDYERLISAGNFFMLFPYHYKNALTLKIICGDDSDKIAGVGGVKEKTLLTHFPVLAERYVPVREICQLANQINQERIKTKQKPLAALQNITNGVERLKKNFELINLHKPILNEEAIQALDSLDAPLVDENRGSSNLYKLMQDDDFLSLYSNYGNFVSYVEPFYTVISREKELYKQYQKNKAKH
jgi:5'-3' exonuclease